MTAERDWRGLLFVAPFLLLYSIILIFPLLRGMWLSLNQVDLFGDGHFVGVGNYVKLAHDPVFLTSMTNTFLVTLMIVPVLTALALMLAIALNNAGKGAALLRGIFFSSAVLSVTIVTLIWRFVLAPDAGLLGELWTSLGWEPLAFLSDEHLVLPAIAVTTIWWSIGLPMLLFLAGLQQIPQDMYEAAALDQCEAVDDLLASDSSRAPPHLGARRHAADRRPAADLRAGAIDDRRRAQRRVADRGPVPVRNRVRPLGNRLRERRGGSAVPDHPCRHAHPILGDRPGDGGAKWPLTSTTAG